MREEGYYWVKHHGEWVIGRFFFWAEDVPMWEVFNLHLQDHEFDEIDERRITRDSLDETTTLKQMIKDGVPHNCVSGYDEVKFCPIRQGEGNACMRCLNF